MEWWRKLLASPLKLSPSLELAQRHIDWFGSRGYLLGERRNRNKYYIVHWRNGEKEFDSIWQAQQYVVSQ